MRPSPCETGSDHAPYRRAITHAAEGLGPPLLVSAYCAGCLVDHFTVGSPTHDVLKRMRVVDTISQIDFHQSPPPINHLDIRIQRCLVYCTVNIVPKGL